MSNTLSVRITSRKTDAGEIYEGTVNMCDATPFKLVRRADKTTRFPTRSAVMAAARNFAKSYGFVDVNFGEPATTTATKAKPKVAAKASATTTAKKAAKKSSVTTKSTAPQQTTTTVTRPNSNR